MTEIAAIVEGQTEQAFVQRLLAPHFGLYGATIWPRLPGKIRRQGGVRSWEAVRQDILRTLCERRGRVCTTMFDFYGMPHSWPGRAEAAGRPSEQRGPFLEECLLRDVAEHAGGNLPPGIFQPYVQMHEFEALLFVDVDCLAHAVSWQPAWGVETLAAKLQHIVDLAGSPESIDDGAETAPSKRIMEMVAGYRKSVVGPIVAERIGLPAIRQKCPHFNAWLSRLEAACQPPNL